MAIHAGLNSVIPSSETGLRALSGNSGFWWSFQEGVFLGNGGRMRTNDPRRREVNALCMQLLMNAIVYYNAEKHGKSLEKILGSSPVPWEHVRRLGDYRITLSRRHVDGVARK